jgi:hypothetical protein
VPRLCGGRVSNYYTMFSEVLTGLTPAGIKWMKEFLRSSDEEVSASEYENFCEKRGLDADTQWPDFDYEFQSDGKLWIYSEESGSPENVVQAVQRYLREFDPEGSFKLRWSCTCSKPVVGEFFGGAAFITAESVAEWFPTDWLKEKEEQWSRERAERSLRKTSKS